jgi:hypothetical protein
MAHVRQLSRVRELDLGMMSRGAMDNGLAHVQGLTGLRELRLGFTDVTDAGLYKLRRLKGLELLDLIGCDHVTDGGLAHLRRLTGLKGLYLDACERVTNRGVEELRKALPNCDISHST